MIEDFSGTGRQPGIARLTWKASETLRGSKRVHFTGITGFQSRECQAVVWMRRITLTAKQPENKTATADTTAPTPLAATGATVATAAVIALILAAAALALYRFRR